MRFFRIATALLVACLSISLFSRADNSATLDSLLSVYDAEVAQSEVYLQQRQSSIDSLVRSRFADRPEVMLDIAELYRPYQSDSSVAYLSKVLDAPEPYATIARIRLVYLLASVGYYSESQAVAQQLRNVPDEHRGEYFEAMERLYGESSVYGKLQTMRDDCSTMAGAYKDSLSAYLRSLSKPDLQLIKMELVGAREAGDYVEALRLSDSVMMLVRPYSHEFAVFAYETSIIYKDMGNEDVYRQWLVRSAIADVRSGITDNGASWMLAQMLFEDGNVDRAYQYIEYSLTNASFFNARLRYMQINPLGHLINQAYQRQQRTMSARLKWSLVALAILLVVLGMMMIYTVHQYKVLHFLNERQVLMNGELQTANARLQEMNAQQAQLNTSLQESNHVKEQYICRYLEVYSDYIQRLTKMARKAGEKDSDAFLNREMAEFYRSFDNTFLSLYRNYVSEFNALLQPEERIYPKQGELLTTELRIFALIKLGIDSSAKIAELLCYSPNTIYNYRARVKNCALGDRDTFENRVREIGTK